MGGVRTKVIDRGVFASLAVAYRRSWPGLRMAVVTVGGERVMSSRWWPGRDDATVKGVQAFALEDSLNWGEPTVSYAPRERLVWVGPVMQNAVVLGGVMVGMEERELYEADATTPRLDVRAACVALREMLEQRNLTNAALLAERRARSARESDKAEALRTMKLDGHASLRRLLFEEEPALLAAVRRGDMAGARAVLNRVLMVALEQAGSRFELVKSVLVEVVASLSRTAVEAGADGEELLGSRFNAIGELAQFQSMEQLVPWLHGVLERTMGAIERCRGATGGLVMADALAYMRANAHRALSRDEVAGAMCLSSSHFSRQFKRHIGRGFVQTLTRIRVELACELLARTDESVARIAHATGFSDQGYLTRVFRKATGVTPLAYRQAKRSGR